MSVTLRKRKKSEALRFKEGCYCDASNLGLGSVILHNVNNLVCDLNSGQQFYFL